MSIEETIAMMKRADREREAKQREMEDLKLRLLEFDSESIGDAVKCYIQENRDTAILTDSAFEAFSIIAKIMVLELEC